MQSFAPSQSNIVNAANVNIKSYALRGGRITAGQRRALEELWPRYGVDANSAPEWESVFGRRAPLVLEIGGGFGEAAVHFAREYPEQNYAVAEVYPPAIGALLRKLAAADLQNVRVIRADARDVLAAMVANDSLHCARIFFPDPWPKKRHRKRRLINADFVRLLAQKIARGGFAHIATDNADYAAQIRECFAACPHFAAVNESGDKKFGDVVAAVHIPPRPPTRFSLRAQTPAADLAYTRK